MSALSDAQLENYYRNRWEDINGYDPLDPEDVEEEEADEDGYIYYDVAEPDWVKRSER